MKTTFITETYFIETYLGKNNLEESGYKLKNKTFDYYAQFATDDIHTLAVIDIRDENIYNQLASKYTEAIERATAILTEYYMVNGTNTNRTSRTAELGTFKSSQSQSASDYRYETAYEKAKTLMANVGLYYYNITEEDLEYLQTEFDWTIADNIPYFVKAFQGATELDPRYFIVDEDGTIKIKTDTLPDNLTFQDGSSVDTQATRAEDVISEEDKRLDQKIDTTKQELEADIDNNMQDISALNERVTFNEAKNVVQDAEINTNTINIATNATSISTVAEIITNLGKEFRGSITPINIGPNSQVAITITQKINTYPFLTLTQPNQFIWNDTTDGLDLTNQSLTIRGNFDASGAGSSVSFRVYDELNVLVYSNTETIQDGGALTLLDQVTLINGKTYTLFAFSTNSVRLTGATIELLGNTTTGGGASVSSEVINDKLANPTLGINEDLNKIDTNEANIAANKTNIETNATNIANITSDIALKADKTYVDTELENKQTIEEEFRVINLNISTDSSILTDLPTDIEWDKVKSIRVPQFDKAGSRTDYFSYTICNNTKDTELYLNKIVYAFGRINAYDIRISSDRKTIKVFSTSDTRATISFTMGLTRERSI